MRTIYLLLCAALGSGAFLCTAANLTVKNLFGNFEEASLLHPKQLGPNYFSIDVQSNDLYGPQGSLGTWACGGINLNGVKTGAGQSVRIVVPTGNRIADLHAVYSTDRKTWKPVPSQRSTWDFDVPLPQGASKVYFATFYPYSYSQMQAHDRKLTASQYVKIAPLGESVHGREIVLVTITDPSVPDSQKKKAFLIGGTHGAETASIYGVEGMLDYLISNDATAQRMRREAIWEIVPILNVDAAAEGLDRRNAAGINLYFDWGFHSDKSLQSLKNPKTGIDPAISVKDFSQPETHAAYQALTAFRPDVFLDVHSWHFAGDGYWGPEPAAKNNKITQLKQTIAKYFNIEHWDGEEYPFASAPTIAKKFNIGATLTEFALSFGPGRQMKTPESMRQQGVEILRGTFECLKSMG